MEAVLNKPETKKGTWGPAALEQRRERSRDHLAKIAGRREGWIDRNRYYYELLSRLLRFLVEPQKRVLSVRCGTGNLLAVVQPVRAKALTFVPRLSRSHSNEILPLSLRWLSRTKRSSAVLSSQGRNSIISSLMISATPSMSFKRCAI